MVIAIICSLVVGGLVAFVVVKLLPGTVLDVVARHIDAQADAGAREMDLRQNAISEQVQTANTELRELRELVATLRRDGAAQQSALERGLEATAATTRQVAEMTGSLREALANPKARGAWGERTAEEVLRLAGFVEGVSYHKQRSVQGGSSIPDFTFLLPHDRVVHMDVKFPVAAYLRHLEATSDLDRQRAAKQFSADVRQRLKELTNRSYIDPSCTVDYLLVFIPNESVYAFLHEHDPDLIDVALRQKAVLCSPMTLFPVLAVIRAAMDHFVVDRTSEQILRRLGAFTDQWEKLTEAVELVGKRLESTQNAFGELNGPRRRAVERTFGQVDELRKEACAADASLDRLTDLSNRRAG